MFVNFSLSLDVVYLYSKTKKKNQNKHVVIDHDVMEFFANLR